MPGTLHVCNYVPANKWLVWIVLVVSSGLYYIMHDFILLRESGICKNHQPQRIPKHMHFVWIPFNPQSPGIPKENLDNMEKCIKLNPGYQVTVWNETEAEKLISVHYPNGIGTYYSYQWKIMKNDAARYYILYHYGGIYLDFDIECVVPFDTIISNSRLEKPGSDIVAAKESGRLMTGYSGLLNSFMATPARHPFMLECISHLHTANRFYLSQSFTVLLSAGAWYFARIYAKYPCKYQIRTLGVHFAYQDGIFMKHKFSKSWRDNTLEVVDELWEWVIAPITILAFLILIIRSIICVTSCVKSKTLT